MDDKQPVVIGELKKDRSSKPLFAVIMLLFIFGAMYVLPEIKKYMDEYDNDVIQATTAWINHVLKKDQQELVKLNFTCKRNTQTLSYYFENNRLITITEVYSLVYDSRDDNDKSSKVNQLEFYKNIVKDLNCRNCSSDISDNGDISTLSLTNVIDIQGVELEEGHINISERKAEYFTKNISPMSVKNELTGKDYICE